MDFHDGMSALGYIPGLVNFIQFISNGQTIIAYKILRYQRLDLGVPYRMRSSETASVKECPLGLRTSSNP